VAVDSKVLTGRGTIINGGRKSGSMVQKDYRGFAIGDHRRSSDMEGTSNFKDGKWASMTTKRFEGHRPCEVGVRVGGGEESSEVSIRKKTPKSLIPSNSGTAGSLEMKGIRDIVGKCIIWIVSSLTQRKESGLGELLSWIFREFYKINLKSSWRTRESM